MIKSNLRKICFEKDIRTITGLSGITGVSRPTIYKLYDNKDVDTVKLETLDTICRTLNCNLTDLIEYSQV